MIKSVFGVGQLWPALAWSGQVRSESVSVCGAGATCVELLPPHWTGLVLLSQWRTGECDPSQHGLPWSLVRPLQGVCHEGEIKTQTNTFYFNRLSRTSAQLHYRRKIVENSLVMMLT